MIDIWHDRRISSGEEIDREINTQLESADIILLLVSSDFIHSDYCFDIEMSRAMERHTVGSTKVIPVILRPCDWHQAPFGMLNATLTDGKPIIDHTSLDQEALDVARAVRIVRMAANELKATALQKSTQNTISNSPPTPLNDRPSNLRTKKKFTDRERHKCQNESFEYIAQYFENSLQELQSRNPEVETSFKRIDANHFEAVAYVNGKEQSRCGIWFGNSASLMDGLLFSYDGIGNDNSYNESMSVGDNGYT